MNKQVFNLLLLSTLSFSNLSFGNIRCNPDFGGYVGASIGSTFNKHTYSGPFDVKVKESKDVERVFGGINFNRYLGLEAGYTSYPTVSIDSSWDSTKIKFDSFDLLAKVSLPLTNRLKFITKGGVSYARYRGEDLMIINYGPDGRATSTGKNSIHDAAFKPLVSAGLSYALTKNVDADVSYMKPIDCCGKGFYSLGFTYKFKQ